MTPTEREAECRAFDAANPDVWAYFESRAMLAWAEQVSRNRQEPPRFSARTLVHLVRWKYRRRIQRTDALGFRINDHMSSYYAAKFLAEHPECGAGFFQTRRSGAAKAWPHPAPQATLL